MLKLKIDKATFDTLSDAVKEQYKANDDETEYTLNVEGVEDVGALRRANDRLKTERDEANRKAQELADKENDENDKNARRRGDIAALELSWKQKRDNDVAAEQVKTKKANDHVEKLLRHNVALSMANEISLAPSVMQRVILDRLAVDFDGDEPKTRVLGADGKPSALTLDDLKKEIRETKEFAPIIKGSNASGGGASGNQGGGAAKAFKDMGDAERTELYRTDPARFKREVDAEKKTQQDRLNSVS